MAAPPAHEKAASLQDASADPESALNYHGNHQDIAIAMVGEHRQSIDPTVEARVVRKIDLFLVPAMFVGYGLVYYDKVRTYCWSIGFMANVTRQFLDLPFSSV